MQINDDLRAENDRLRRQNEVLSTNHYQLYWQNPEKIHENLMYVLTKYRIIGGDILLFQFIRQEAERNPSSFTILSGAKFSRGDEFGDFYYSANFTFNNFTATLHIYLVRAWLPHKQRSELRTRRITIRYNGQIRLLSEYDAQ